MFYEICLSLAIYGVSGVFTMIRKALCHVDRALFLFIQEPVGDAIFEFYSEDLPLVESDFVYDGF